MSHITSPLDGLATRLISLAGLSFTVPREFEGPRFIQNMAQLGRRVFDDSA